SSYQSSVLIVAGGGGGASDNGNGGNGGGTSGTAGNGTGGCAAGTQTSGSAWGYATDCSYTGGECGGGGGGWYGGYSATAENYAGGGGSGYLNPILTSASTTAGQQTGNGKAKITATIEYVDVTVSSAGSYTIVCNDCPVIAAPTAYSASGCGYAPLTASAPTGCVVDWYDAASGGNLVHTGSPFDATTSGTYYAESRNSSSNCTSSTRTSATATVWIFNAGAVSGSATRCQGTDDDIIISATEAQGKPTIYYKWYMDGEEIASSNTQNYTIPGSTIATLSPGTYTFTRMAFNHCGGEGYVESSGSFTLTIIEQPTATVTNGDQHLCKDASATALGLDVSGASGMSPTYQWYKGEALLTGETNSTYTPSTSAAGTSSYHCIVSFSGETGCESATSDNASVEVYTLPSVTSVTVDYDKTCVNADITLTANTTAGSGAITEYSWGITPYGGGDSHSTGSANTCTMTPHAGGTYTYIVTVTDEHGCEAIGSKSGVKVYSDVAIAVSPSQTTYDPNTDITFTATPMLGASNGTVGDCTYDWESTITNGSIGSSNVLTHAPSISTHYVVVATVTGIGCTIAHPQDISVNFSSGGAGEICDGSAVIYCSSDGTGDVGSSTKPVKLDVALTLADGIDTRTASNPVIIRMASGTYSYSVPIELKSNVIIDGGWTANTTTGVWKKGTATSTISRTDILDVSDRTTMPRLTAIEGNSVSGFKIQDVTVTTANAPANSAPTGYFGVSTYAMHLNNCSNYEIIRCNLQAGNASAGGAGANGSAGSAGGNGVQGIKGDYGRGGDDRAGGAGGAGGADGFSYGTNAGAGGAGGSGGSSGTNAGATNGNNGNSAGSVSGGSKGYVTEGWHSAGGAGSVGTAGSNGTNGTNATAQYGNYFIPKAGTDGTNGNGGSGGGGGAGGQGDYDSYGISRYADAGGNGGSGGGGGGGGGQCGKKGYGGGSSVGLYLYNTSLTSTAIV
ncbi:MAG: hypothetical protein II815_01020, partial [Bacteroidales bacterium]|nr:hypothetical protein [Bacteroidales bacterium]